MTKGGNLYFWGLNDLQVTPVIHIRLHPGTVGSLGPAVNKNYPQEVAYFWGLNYLQVTSVIHLRLHPGTVEGLEPCCDRKWVSNSPISERYQVTCWHSGGS